MSRWPFWNWMDGLLPEYRVWRTGIPRPLCSIADLKRLAPLYGWA